MTILYQTKTAFASGTGALTVAALTGAVANDFILLLVESANEVVNPPSGYTAISGSPVSTGTAAAAGGVRLSAFYRIAAGADTSTSIPDSGNHTTAIKLLYRGVDPVSPFAGTNTTSIQATASTAITCPGITTTAANSRVVHCIALDLDAASTAAVGAPTNANLLGLNERHDQTITSGAGGGLAIIDGLKETAGASGNTTATGTSSIRVYLTFALRDYVPVTNHALQASPAATASAIGNLSVVEQFAILGTPTAAARVTAVGNLSVQPGSFSLVTRSTFVGDTIYLPALDYNDVAIAVAFRNSFTVPTVPAGWTSVTSRVTGSAGAMVVAWRTGFRSNAASLRPTRFYSNVYPGGTVPQTYGCAFNNGAYYVYEQSNVLVSYDGLIYQSAAGSFGTAISQLAYSGSEVIGVGHGPSKGAFYLHSTDFVNFTERAFNVPGAGITSSTDWTAPQNFRFQDGRFLAASASSPGILIESADGINWRNITPSSPDFLRHPCYGNGVYLVLSSGIGSSLIRRSTDGVTWTSVSFPVASYGDATLKFLNGVFFLANGLTQQVWTSTDGLTWTARATNDAATATWQTVFYGAGFFYVVASNGNTRYFSDDFAITGSFFTTADVSFAGGPSGVVVAGLKFSSFTYGPWLIQSGEPAGVFTNAIGGEVVVYRGVDPVAPIGNFSVNSGTSATANVAALTQNPSSAVVAFLGTFGTTVTHPESQNGLNRRNSVATATHKASTYDTGAIL